MWPTVLACCFPLILVVVWSGPFDLAFLGVPILFITWTCAALLALTMAIISARPATGGGQLRCRCCRSRHLSQSLKRAPSGHSQWRPEKESISKPRAAATLRKCRSFRRRVNLVSLYGAGVDWESDTPLSTTRAMKSCCRNSRRLGRRGSRIPRSHCVVRGDPRWAITSTSFGPAAELFTGWAAPYRDLLHGLAGEVAVPPRSKFVATGRPENLTAIKRVKKHQQDQ
jgi:hypothetical protein